MAQRCKTDLPAALQRTALLFSASAPALPAHAFFLEGEALDTLANALALIVIVIVPITVVVLFWLVHVLPEKIAHKRQHPQTDAIRTLCLLSLVFGGILWPLAWLWAFSKPVLYKIAYGTDRLAHDTASNVGEELAARPSPAVRAATPAGFAIAAPDSADTSGIAAEITRMRASADRMLLNNGAPRELAVIRDQLAALELRPKGQLEELFKVEELH